MNARYFFRRFRPDGRRRTLDSGDSIYLLLKYSTTVETATLEYYTVLFFQPMTRFPILCDICYDY